MLHPHAGNVVNINGFLDNPRQKSHNFARVLILIFNGKKLMAAEVLWCVDYERRKMRTTTST